MNKNNPDTDKILDAIKMMMSEGSVSQDQELPKDVIELTNPISEEKKTNEEKIDILELSNPITDENNIIEKRIERKESSDSIINESQIKRAVRNAIDSLPSSRLDEIINEELTKIIQEKLNSSKIIISTEDKNN